MGLQHCFCQHQLFNDDIEIDLPGVRWRTWQRTSKSGSTSWGALETDQTKLLSGNGGDHGQVLWSQKSATLCDDYGDNPKPFPPPSLQHLRATSHTRAAAHDHCKRRILIGRKGGDGPSSLHTRRWRPKGPKKSSWMKSLHGVLHGGLWIRFHGLPEFTSGLPPRGGPDANSRRPWIL